MITEAMANEASLALEADLKSHSKIIGFGTGQMIGGSSDFNVVVYLLEEVSDGSIPSKKDGVQVRTMVTGEIDALEE